MGQPGLDGDAAAGQTDLKISIITPTLNRAHMIETAVQSVVAQRYANVEHLIVDSESTDDTLERLSRYPHLRIVSEPDGGLYDAYNKGVRLASGDVIGFLNDDDYYEEGVFEKVAEEFQAPQRPEVVSGQLEEPSSERLTLETMNLDPNKFALNARFFDKSIFREVGTFDTTYKVGADWDFMIRVAMYGPRIRYVSKVAYQYREHDQQISFGRHQPDRAHTAYRERLAILEALLASSSTTASDRRALRRLHSSEALTAVGVAMAHRWPGRAAGDALRGIRYDPLFLGRLGSRLVRRATRGRAGADDQATAGAAAPNH